VAATVNGEVIMFRELEERAGSAYLQAEAMPPGRQRDEARAEALRRAFDQLVAEKLFGAQVKELGVEVSEAQIDQAIAQVKKDNGFADDAQFAQALGSAGLDLAAYRKRIARELENYRLLQLKVGEKVKVSEEDLKNYYQSHPQEFEGEDEVHVRHVFLPLPEDAPPAGVAKVQAEGNRVLQRLKTGEDFAKVAREVSRGPSAEDGGDLGWLRRGTIQKALEDAAFALPDGGISGLVRAGPGVHILKVEGRRKGGARTFEEAKDEIRNRLIDQQGESYREQYVAELRRDAIIEVRIPDLQ
jgi:peptidyl-prolyl cis-trans isomerase SurA